jgi:hypothetical protein
MFLQPPQNDISTPEVPTSYITLHRAKHVLTNTKHRQINFVRGIWLWTTKCGRTVQHNAHAFVNKVTFMCWGRKIRVYTMHQFSTLLPNRISTQSLKEFCKRMKTGVALSNTILRMQTTSDAIRLSTVDSEVTMGRSSSKDPYYISKCLNPSINP